MLDELIAWAESVVGTDYTFSKGMWLDHPGVSGDFIAAVMANGGPPVDVDDRRPRYRIILLGPRKGREHTGAVQAAIEALTLAAMGDSTPCGAASVRAVGEPAGPGFTTEDRPWFSVDLEVVF